MGDLHLSSLSNAQKYGKKLSESRLEHLLEIFDGIPPGDHSNGHWKIEGNPMTDWYAVLSGEAIIALFRDEQEADRFRLSMINRELDR
jgi:hypothetical protein